MFSSILCLAKCNLASHRAWSAGCGLPPCFTLNAFLQNFGVLSNNPFKGNNLFTLNIYISKSTVFQMKVSQKVKIVKSKDVQLQCACCPSALTYMGVTFNLQLVLFVKQIALTLNL